MRIFLTGASGLLGINFALTAARSHDLLGIYHHRRIATPIFQTQHLDLLDKHRVQQLLEQWQPDWIVHCAALAEINECEANPALAEHLNVQLSKQLAELAAQNKIKFLYISTDCVFDGKKKEGYCEDDLPNPINVYGKTKLAGENALLSHCPDALIARVNFYGWSLTGSRSLAEWLINNLRKENNISGFSDVYFSPLLVNSLANVLLQMMTLNLTGLYHVVGSEQVNKYEFAVNLARQFNLNEKLIRSGSVKEIPSKVERPLNMVLCNHKLQAALNKPLPGLADDLKWFHDLELEGYANQLLSINGEYNGN